MIGFYHGVSAPQHNAKEGIYFVKEGDKAYSIYVKVDDYAPVKYANLNEVTSTTISDLWNQIGANFVQKTFTVAGLDLQNNIGLEELQQALKLKTLAYKDSATGTIEDFVTELEGVNYTPTGQVEVNLGYDNAVIAAGGSFTPSGSVTGTNTAEGQVSLKNDANGLEITGSVSAPEITPFFNTGSISQIASVGTLPSYTPATYVAPTLSTQTASFATQASVISTNADNPGVLIVETAPTVTAITSATLTGGSYTEAQFNPGTLPTTDTASVVTDITSIQASQPQFTGSSISAEFVGKPTNIDAIFKGATEPISVEGTYDKAKVTSATFKGEVKNIKPTLQKEDKTITVN